MFSAFLILAVAATTFHGQDQVFEVDQAIMYSVDRVRITRSPLGFVRPIAATSIEYRLFFENESVLFSEIAQIELGLTDGQQRDVDRLKQRAADFRHAFQKKHRGSFGRDYPSDAVDEYLNEGLAIESEAKEILLASQWERLTQFRLWIMIRNEGAAKVAELVLAQGNSDFDRRMLTAGDDDYRYSDEMLRADLAKASRKFLQTCSDSLSVETRERFLADAELHSPFSEPALLALHHELSGNESEIDPDELSLLEFASMVETSDWHPELGVWTTARGLSKGALRIESLLKWISENREVIQPALSEGQLTEIDLLIEDIETRWKDRIRASTQAVNLPDDEREVIDERLRLDGAKDVERFELRFERVLFPEQSRSVRRLLEHNWKVEGGAIVGLLSGNWENDLELENEEKSVFRSAVETSYSQYQSDLSEIEQKVLRSVYSGMERKCRVDFESAIGPPPKLSWPRPFQLLRTGAAGQ